MFVVLATVVMADDPRTSGAPISFTLPKPGRVSMAVYDKDGVQVRTLRNAEPLAAGAHTAYWTDWAVRGNRCLRASTHGSCFNLRDFRRNT